MDRNLALEVVRVTEASALFASRYAGRGDENLALSSANEAMKRVFDSVSINGKVVIGSLSFDDKNNEENLSVGNGNGPDVDVVVDSLDGEKTCARGRQNAISAVAMGEPGAFYKAPPLYMEKIAVGADAKGIIDITKPPDVNIKRIARAKDKYIEDVTVCILDRERHNELIEKVREIGARIVLITDGDISGAVAAAMEDRQTDILMGIGGAKEGVLAAAALKCLGGDMQGRFAFMNKKERDLVRQTGEADPDRIFALSDLVMGKDIMFSATGVTDGELLKGVRYLSGGAETNSIVMRTKTRTLRFITAEHHFDHKPLY